MSKNADIANLASDLRATLGMLKRRLRERGGTGDLTPSQTEVLRQLHHHGSATVSRLARLVGIRPQSMGTVIAGLEAKKLVSGSPDPNDARQTLISLTRRCRNRIAKGDTSRQDWLASQIERLSPEEQAHLCAAADILRRFSED